MRAWDSIPPVATWELQNADQNNLSSWASMSSFFPWAKKRQIPLAKPAMGKGIICNDDDDDSYEGGYSGGRPVNTPSVLFPRIGHAVLTSIYGSIHFTEQLHMPPYQSNVHGAPMAILHVIFLIWLLRRGIGVQYWSSLNLQLRARCLSLAWRGY